MEPALREILGESNAAAKDIPIDLYVDEMPLVLEGCGIGALSEIDADQADRVSARRGRDAMTRRIVIAASRSSLGPCPARDRRRRTVGRTRPSRPCRSGRR
jgi:hypothetical protein